MIKYKLNGLEVLKDGHTMFPEDITRELNIKAYLEERVSQLEMVCHPKKAKVANGSELIESLLNYDEWKDQSTLFAFVDKYKNKDVEVFMQGGDFFILEDNNVVMPADSFTFK